MSSSVVARAFDVIVIGAGAAGMMCAAVAGQRGRRVLLIDHAHKLAEKIRISGGGRCNFTNLHCRPENYLSQNPHFCRSALARYGPQDFIKLVERYGIGYHEKTLGQLFCDDSAVEIIDMLKAECEQGQVHWRMPCKVLSITREGEGFRLHTDHDAFTTASLVIATGGLSVPKIGASPFGYQVAEQFGLKVVPPRPALVPLSFDPQTMARALADFSQLAGMSLDAEMTCGEGRFRESLLITHRGLSGPSILQISSYWQAALGKEALCINLLPDPAEVAWLRQRRASKTHFSNLLAELLPKRFAEQWCAVRGLSIPTHQLAERTFEDALAGLQSWQVNPSGTLGYNKAEVTLGGIDTTYLSSKTMAATAVPSLFFIGEVVDVTGHLGGFNFQWAWASAQAAGQVA